MKDETAERRIPPASEVFQDEGLRKAAALAEAGDVAGLRALNIDLDAMAPGNVNLLMYYLTAQNEVAVRALLEAGAGPNVLSPSGTSPMLTAAVADDSKWLTLLLDHGGDPNLENLEKEPLITRLAYFGAWDNILLLLDRGADINATGPSGKTVTYLFGALYQFDRVYALLERGADPTILTAHGLDLKGFVEMRVPADSQQVEWQKKVAERLGN
jgi:hypothetical protein